MNGQLTRIPFSIQRPAPLLDLFKMFTTKTYGTTQGHILLVKDMAKRAHVTDAEVLRVAIEQLHEHFDLSLFKKAELE